MRAIDGGSRRTDTRIVIDCLFDDVGFRAGANLGPVHLGVDVTARVTAPLEEERERLVEQGSLAGYHPLVRTLRRASVVVGLALVTMGSLLYHYAIVHAQRDAERSYGALVACLEGGPLGAGETLLGRLHAIELGLSGSPDPDARPLDRTWPESCRTHAERLSADLAAAPRDRLTSARDGLREPLAKPFVPPDRGMWSERGGLDPHRRSFPTQSAEARSLAAWSDEVSAAAQRLGLAAFPADVDARPRWDKPAITRPVPKLAHLTLRHVSHGRTGLVARAFLRDGPALVIDGSPPVLRLIAMERTEELEPDGADEDAQGPLFRPLYRNDRLVDEAGTVLARGQELGSVAGYATRTGALVLACERPETCVLQELRREGHTYTATRTQSLPRGARGGVPLGLALWFDERAPSHPLHVTAPDAPFGPDTVLSPTPSAFATPWVCRSPALTSLVVQEASGEPASTLVYFHDGRSWSSGRRVSAPRLTRRSDEPTPHLSCDDRGVDLVSIAGDRVEMVRCTKDGCAATMSELEGGPARRDAVGLGEDLLVVQVHHRPQDFRAEFSAWLRFGPPHALGREKLLIGDPAHGGAAFTDVRLEAIAAGAVLELRDVDGSSFVWFDRGGVSQGAVDAAK